ncbi:TRAP transporter substrate-binding protein [Mesorhizobium sp. L-8-3]|uniref:TRAP transporter substrate-binding protein n=1 Tax=Mesorhizobium sp. L-8-3 TaxID=2744522 RepID=UPI001926DF65|nr:TRAP transporter substrate-binding protein [Mesorhizobium sp. L-8-3]BCH23369.1 C4-dicarboxylate ABC transporter [Mesorhizobium sp. L-8-3]
MQNHNRLALAITAVIAVTGPVVLPASAATLRLACPSAPDNPTCLAASRFAEEAKRKSDGSLDIQVFPSGQLGKGKEAIQQMQAGIIDLVVEDISNYANFAPDYNVVSWGFAFRDEDHFLAFLDSPLHEEMAGKLRDQGIELVAANWRKLPRVVVSTKPVKAPEDLAGLKFRVPPIPSYIETWKTLGANPTQVPWSDSFQALKTGVVDAMEAPLDSVVSQKFHLAAPHVTLTNHVFASIALTINKTRHQSLSDAERKAIDEAAAIAADYSAELAAEARNSVREQIKADGGEIIEVETAPFAAKLEKAAHQQEADGLWSQGLYDRIEAMK